MSHDAPLVSVIMNCYNSSEHLREALQSVMAQTFTDFEIVFWDNCSTDESPAIANSFGGRIRYFRGDHTVPLGAGRNLAIARARGKYIAFLDCDDLWDPAKLGSQVALFEANPRLGLVTTDTIVFDGKRELRRVFASSKPGRGMVYEDLIRRQWISMSSAMVSREALASLTEDPSAWNGGWFDETLNVCEEADVFYRIAHDWELDYVDAPYTRWRVHGSSTTFRKFAQFARETRYILEKQRKLYPGFDVQHAGIVELLKTRSTFEEGVALWREGRGAEARRVIAPYRKSGRKFMALWILSYFPNTVFDLAAKVYFALPKIFHS